VSGQLILELTLGTVLMFLVAVAGTLLAWKKLRSERSANAAERLGDAAERLTSERLELRINGLLELERVVKEFRHRREDAILIVVAFIRSRTRMCGLASISSGERAMATRILAKRRRRPVRGRAYGLDLSGLDLGDLDFSDSQLGSDQALVPAASLRHANLRRTNFDRAVLTWCNFWGARARRASFVGANLRSAVFVKARLRSADFSYADLRDARFNQADVRGAVFLGANLATARGLTAAQLATAVVDDHTILPAVLDPNRVSFAVAIRALLDTPRRLVQRALVRSGRD
jgi:uncharacterized protein YjbI with pentapeptide repeats